MINDHESDIPKIPNNSETPQMRVPDSPEATISRETHELLDALKVDLKNIWDRHDQEEVLKFLSDLGFAPDKKGETPQLSKDTEKGLFHPIDTSWITYIHIANFFPEFTEKCRQSLLGKNPLLDTAWLLIGFGESAVQMGKTLVDMFLDTLRLIAHPIQEYRSTQEALKII